MAFIKELYFYPVKSLKGIQVDKAMLVSTGMQYDREWMLIDENLDFVSQREFPQLALFKCVLSQYTLDITYGDETISVPLAHGEEKALIPAKVWGRHSAAYEVDELLSNWFSIRIGTSVKLVRKYPEYTIPVKNHEDAEINFPDSQQYLVVGSQSLEDLNSRMDERIGVDRFRANIIIETDQPYIEDDNNGFTVDGLTFLPTKPCGRCKIVNIDQESGVLNKEPLATLAKYRKEEKKVFFGQYFKLSIARGDECKVLKAGSKVDWL